MTPVERDIAPVDRDMAPVERGMAPVEGGEIYFEVFGEGEPIVLLHSGFTDIRDWKYQTSALSKEFKVVVYDHRTAGKSSLPEKPFSHSKDLKMLLDHLNINRASLVGHSVGGATAIDFALEYPERVEKIVVIASTLSGYEMSKEFMSWNYGLLPAWGKPNQVAKQVLEFEEYPAYAVAMKDQDTKAFLQSIVSENAKKAAPWSWEAAPPLPPQQSANGLLHELKLPVLTIVGDNDGKDMIEIANKIEKEAKNVNMIVFEDADHALNLEFSEKLNQVLLNFLK